MVDRMAEKTVAKTTALWGIQMAVKKEIWMVDKMVDKMELSKAVQMVGVSILFGIVGVVVGASLGFGIVGGVGVGVAIKIDDDCELGCLDGCKLG
jgi:hypothetical protein